MQLLVSGFYVKLILAVGILIILHFFFVELFWSGITILKNVIKESPNHEQFIRDINFVPILTNHLNSNLSLERKVSLLFLLQELTYGITMEWEHPFVGKLIPILVDHILSETEQENVIILSLSILINICQKNSVVLYRLLRTIPKVSILMDKIRPLGILVIYQIIVNLKINFNKSHKK